MPYTSLKRRRACAAASMRRARSYPAAVRAGHPKALEAERQRIAAENAMRPADALFAEVKALPITERGPLAAKHAAELARCLDVRDSARADYERLRAEIIAEAEAFS